MLSGKNIVSLGLLASVFLPVYAYPMHEAKNKKGGVASESKICSQIGIDAIKDGGTAADAMVATVLCVGVTGMYHSGIGGGGFMLVRAPNGTYTFIDFRETAPAASYTNMYTNNTAASIYGGLASGVPGELRGLEHLHKLHGKLPWSRLILPSAKVARKGFAITADTVRYMNSAVATTGYDFLTNDPTWAIDFAPNGTRKGLGDILTRHRYADTLEAIAERGADAFYTGPIANATINELKRTGGIMTLTDLANYTVAIRPTLNIDYHGFKVTSCQAPSGGPVVLAALNIFGGFADGATVGLNLSTHRLDESMRFAYGMRTQLGDPNSWPNITAYAERMVDGKTADEARAGISDFKAFDVAHYDPAGIQNLETPGTSAVMAADASGLAISLTTTINLLFGSLVMVPETGIIMNNEMNDFSIPGSSNAFGYIPSPSNYIHPFSRPLSSIAPVIVEFLNSSTSHSHPASSPPYLTIGGAGGSRIITSVLQNVIHLLPFSSLSSLAAGTSISSLTTKSKPSTQDVLAKARLHDQLIPATTTFEWSSLNIEGYENGTVAFLKSVGHNVSWVAPGQSAVQAVRWFKSGGFEAAGEPRQGMSGGITA